MSDSNSNHIVTIADNSDSLKKNPTEEYREDKKTSFIEVLKSQKSLGNISKACKLVGISRQTIYEWRNKDPEFNILLNEAIKVGKITLADLAEEALSKRIAEGDTTAIIFTLKSLRREFYSETKATVFVSDITNDNNFKRGENGNPSNATDMINMMAMYSHYFKLISQESNIMTDDLNSMFEKIIEIVQTYK